MELICQVRSTSERKQLEAISAHGYISYLGLYLANIGIFLPRCKWVPVCILFIMTTRENLEPLTFALTLKS